MKSIEIKKLSLNFGEVVVLKDLDLSIEKGEIFGSTWELQAVVNQHY